MSDFDFDAAVRWARFDPRKTLALRDDDELPFLTDMAEAGQEVLPDTCVYIDGLQGRAPDIVANLLDIRQSNHSTIAVQELMHTVGVLDPEHPGTRAAIRQIRTMIREMAAHRIFVPDAETLGARPSCLGFYVGCRVTGGMPAYVPFTTASSSCRRKSSGLPFSRPM